VSRTFILGAGGLVVVALATPYVGAIVGRGAAVRPAIRVVAMAGAVPVPAVTPTPVMLAPPPLPEPAATVPEMVYGDAKTADFDPEHPPARMGEAG